MPNTRNLLLVLIPAIALSGCELAGGLIKTGFGLGIILVIILVLAISWIWRRLRGRDGSA